MLNKDTLEKQIAELFDQATKNCEFDNGVYTFLDTMHGRVKTIKESRAGYQMLRGFWMFVEGVEYIGHFAPLYDGEPCCKYSFLYRPARPDEAAAIIEQIEGVKRAKEALFQ